MFRQSPVSVSPGMNPSGIHSIPSSSSVYAVRISSIMVFQFVPNFENESLLLRFKEQEVEVEFLSSPEIRNRIRYLRLPDPEVIRMMDYLSSFSFCWVRRSL